MEPAKSIQELLEDKLTKKIIEILLTTFKLEENFLQLSKHLKTSRPTLKDRIDLLQEYKIILRDKTKIHLSTDIEIFKLLNESIPINKESKNYKIETLQRELVYQYIIRHKDPDNFFKPRPTDNFDIRESIHPSISISNKLEITEASESFYELFKDDVPNGINKRLLLNFFKGINIYEYDAHNDIIKDTLVYTKIYKELIYNGNAQLDACYIKKSGEKVFLSIFVIIQTNFIGMQSIFNNITERVQTQRIRKRLTHRFYHLISVVDSISDKLKVLDIDNEEFKFLTNQLDKLSSFDYLENIYVANTGGEMEAYRDFKLNRNLKSILDQLRFLYDIPKEKLVFNPSEYSIKISKTYDIYFYEGLYLLIENLILKSNNGCHCTIHSYKKNNIVYIEAFFSEPINHQIELFIKSLKSEIIKNSCINKNHLHLKIFLDELSKEAILELVVSTYFDKIIIGNDNKNIIFKLKDIACNREVNELF
jgi:DNA-binding Lrp family transcriptional regulator